MNIDYIDDLMIPIITAGALCIGYIMKKWMPQDDKWIPTVLGVLGALSGLILFGANYEGVVKGLVSGLAAVGLHQLFKQQLKLDACDKIQTSFNAEGLDEMQEVIDYEDKDNETEEQ